MDWSEGKSPAAAERGRVLSETKGNRALRTGEA